MTFATPDWIHQEVVCTECKTPVMVDAFPVAYWAAKIAAGYRCGECQSRRYEPPPASRQTAKAVSSRPRQSRSTATSPEDRPTLFEVMEKARRASSRGGAVDADNRSRSSGEPA